MTDNEIIEALECCIKDDYDKGCTECPVHCYKGCDFHLAKFALDLINRQQAEIERLQNTIISLSDYLDILGIDKTDTSIVRTATELNAQIRADVKAEVIKQFAERVKSRLITVTYMNFDDIIDNLVKEIEGENIVSEND